MVAKGGTGGLFATVFTEYPACLFFRAPSPLTFQSEAHPTQILIACVVSVLDNGPVVVVVASFAEPLYGTVLVRTCSFTGFSG